jgi:tRNA(Ile)-lysidine synthase
VALRERFRAHVLARGFFAEGDRLVLACSGGLDSCVLAHLLRFTPGLPSLQLVLAHFDHRMRRGSAGDALWVRGLARAWDVAVVIRRAQETPGNEADARTARYSALTETKEAESARWLLTAHHADDQAETVLFRVLRGTGLQGLRGIPERGVGGVLRPLLPFRRVELEAYARRWRVPFRADPTNVQTRYARNVIRNELLPRAEAAVASGASRSLVRLARLARQEEEAWRSLLPTLLSGVLEATGEGSLVIDRRGLLGYHPAVRARLLRELSRRLGGALDEAGTRAALEFTSSGASGRRCTLAGGLILSREFDRLVLSTGAPPGPFGCLELAAPGEGEGTFALGGRTWRAQWTRSRPASGLWTQGFDPGSLSFPLKLRGWVHGDRIRMGYGSKKLKKLFAEARVPAAERSLRPVLVDQTDRVLWIPGLARSSDAPEGDAGARLTISVTETETV